MAYEIEVTVTKPLTELQITKDNSIQSIPLSNEAYKQIMERNHARQDGTADKDKGYV